MDPPPRVAKLLNQKMEVTGLVSATAEAMALHECVARPEALIGWRINVSKLGEGIVVAVKRRFGRSPLHVIAPSLDSSKIKLVMLCRKRSHSHRLFGRSFELLKKEF